jgi:hypothetical protein
LPTYAQRKKIFINYRVQDTAAETGRLVDALKQAFYEDQIFMDIEKLEPGVDFRQALARSLETCDVLFAIIGTEWTGTDKNGNSRIKQPEDWVRIELETAFKRDIRAIPILMGGASLPAMEDLPESLYPLLNRQTYEISNKRWSYDTEQLINFLKKIGFTPKKPEPPLPQQSAGVGKWLIYGLFALAVLAIGVLLFESSGNKRAQEDLTVNPIENDAGKIIRNADDNSSSGFAGDTDAVKEENIPAVPVNVAGAWYDAVNQYTMYIEQTGSTLQLKSITAAGITTGEGLGTVEGDKMNFKMQLYNIGVISGSGIVRKNSQSLNGKFVVTGNGASYTEDFHWTKQ